MNMRMLTVPVPEPVYLDALAQADSRFLPYRDGIELRQGPLQWCDGWLHEVGQMGEPEVMKDKRRVIGEILAPHLKAAQPR